MKTIDIKNDTELYLFDNDNFDNTYNVLNGAKLKVFQYVRNISGKVFVNLASSNALVEYHFSTINTDNNTFELIINHNESKTTSNVYYAAAFMISVRERRVGFHAVGSFIKKERFLNAAATFTRAPLRFANWFACGDCH